MSSLSWVEAAVIGALQGVAELFPVSSLGHSILLPAVIGGSWAHDLDVSAPESPYLAFIVGLHIATALALVIYFWRDWVRIVRGLVTSIVRREVSDPDQRLAWLLVLGTISVGIAGLLLEHTFRTVLSKPVPTAAFLLLNGLVLLAAEQLRRRADNGGPASTAGGRHAPHPTGEGSDRGPDEFGALQDSGGNVDERVSGPASDARLAAQPVGRAVLIAAAQIAALAPGISRSGITIAAGLRAGLSHEERRPVLLPPRHPRHRGGGAAEAG